MFCHFVAYFGSNQLEINLSNYESEKQKISLKIEILHAAPISCVNFNTK